MLWKFTRVRIQFRRSAGSMRALLLIVVCIRAQHHSDPYQSVQNSKDLRAQYNQEHRAHQATHERKRLEASRKKEVKKNRDEFHKARQNSKDKRHQPSDKLKKAEKLRAKNKKKERAQKAWKNKEL